jgi:hypothetical protein
MVCDITSDVAATAQTRTCRETQYAVAYVVSATT